MSHGKAVPCLSRLSEWRPTKLHRRCHRLVFPKEYDTACSPKPYCVRLTVVLSLPRLAGCRSHKATVSAGVTSIPTQCLELPTLDTAYADWASALCDSQLADAQNFPISSLH